MHKLKIIPVLFAVSILFFHERSNADNECTFSKIDLSEKSIGNERLGLYEWIATIDNFRFLFSGNKFHNDMKIKIAKVRNLGSGAECNLEIDDSGSTRAVYLAGKSKRLFIPQSYGTGDEYSIFDLSTCQKIPAKLEVYLTEINRDSILSKSVCEPTKNPGKCSCSPAKVYTLDSKCNPKLNQAASVALTKETIGTAKPGEEIVCPKN